MAFSHRPLSFPEPSAELVPFIIGVAQHVFLLALRTFDGLLVNKRAANRWHAVYDSG